MAVDPDEALLTALTTEQFVLQSARGVISSEASSRALLYVGAVSSGLVALGFASQLSGAAFEVFVAAVLPALIVLGEFTFVRLVEVNVEDLRYLEQIQRIRTYYGQLGGRAGEFFPSQRDDGYMALFRVMGLADRSRFQTLFTAASTVTAINGIVAASAGGLAVRRTGAHLAIAVGVGVVAVAAWLLAHLRWERQQYERGLGGSDVAGPVNE